MRLLALLLILAASLCAQQDGRRSSAAAEPVEGAQYIGNPAAIERGQTLFVTVCSGCHGVHGDGGRGPRLIDASNTRRASNSDLFSWIQKGIPGTDMPPVALPDEQIWELAAFVRNLGAPAFEQPLPGDPEAGRELFFGKSGCTQCHMIRGQGGLLGPDLSDAGSWGKQVRLREGILEANLRISEGFTPVVVKLKSGAEISGVAKNSSNYSMQVLDAGGQLHLLRKADLESVVYRAKTWMPDDYAKRLSAGEIDDLVSFLSRQVIRVPAPAERNAQGRARRQDDDN
jgi:putative heme-binding domain-containing protein